MRHPTRLIGITLVLILMITSASWAIPAFARKYKFSCTTCHEPFPRLKPYGDDFAGEGFMLPEEDSERDYVTAGDDLQYLNRDFPIAARMEAYGVYDQDRDVETDLQSPWGIKFMSGGTLYKGIGYYFYFYMSERGEVAGVEDAYVHFNNVFGSNLDIMVGQFQTSDPLMKRELRLTFEDYQIYTRRVGRSVTNLTYDRGVMLVYGIDETSTDLVAMIVNGNGKQEAGGDRKFDIDSKKNLGFRVNQAIGDRLSVGGFYYTGKEVIDNYTNEITYYGPDMSLSLGPVDFTGQYLIREDTNPRLFNRDNEGETTGWVLEAIVAPHRNTPRYYFTALYNQIDSEITTIYPTFTMGSSVPYETFTLSGTYLLARNLRLIGEYTRDLEHNKNRVVMGFVSGF